MNYEQNMGFTRQTVQNFRFFDANSMEALATDLTLPLSVKELLFCRDHFRMREGRDPTVGELQFLGSFATLWRQNPASVAVEAITGTEEAMRVFADIQRMRLPFTETNSTPDVLMEAAGRYLERGGITPYHPNLCCGATADMAARAAGQHPSLALDVGAVSAMLAPPPIQQDPRAWMLVLLLPTGNDPFPVEVARFFANHWGFGLSAPMAIGAEGVLTQLLQSGQGFSFDLAPFARDFAVNSLADALSIGQNAVLFRAPDEVLPRLFAEGSPIAVCGMLNGSGRAEIRRGSEICLSLSPEIFTMLKSVKSIRVPLSEQHEEQTGRGFALSGHSLLAGVAARGGCSAALLSVLGEVAAKGGDMNRATLTAVLEFPPQKQDAAINSALPLILDYHRICAELALPGCAHRMEVRQNCEKPTLTVFVCAERGENRAQTFAVHWQTAAEQRDFAALRRLLHPFA